MPDLFLDLTPKKIIDLHWEDLKPYYDALAEEAIHAGNIEDWMRRWTAISEVQDEIYNRAYVATSINTVDKDAETRFDSYIEKIYPSAMAVEQKLKEKLLASGLTVPGFEIALRNMRAQADLFREENLPLQIEEEKLTNAHDKIMGAQTVQWEDEERTVRQMEVLLRDKDPETRLAGWETMAKRQLADRDALNKLWIELMELRAKIAKNAGLPSFREFRWQKLQRFDYSPEDSKSFQDAIEQAVVPAATRLAERRKEALGLDIIRYCDIFVDPSDAPALKPFSTVEALKESAAAIFSNVLPKFGEYFKQMGTEGLLDLENRKNKANGAYCTDFSYTKRPFMFANAVGIHDDVQSVLHEGGHCFHAFECFHLPYFQQRSESALPMEFAEVASMAMEFMSLRYLSKEYGGFYTDEEAARAQIEHIEQSLIFWPYMAIVDAFQHWAYENHIEGKDPDQCDATWAKLEDRFRPHIDWTGYEEVKKTGWHRKPHIFQIPFYYVEYGLAQLGAVQIWQRALSEKEEAVEDYRKALSLGGTATLPELFRTAGANFAFDAGTLGQAVDHMERTIYALEQKN